MSFVATVVAVGRCPALVSSLVFYGRSNLNRYMILSPDFRTGIKEMSHHSTAVALLVPGGPLTAGAVVMTGKSTVSAVLIGALTHSVTHSGTKAAGDAFFGFRAVFRQMSDSVAISTVDVFVSIISACHPLHNCPNTPIFVGDLGLSVFVRDHPLVAMFFIIFLLCET